MEPLAELEVQVGRNAGLISEEERRIDAISRRLDSHISGCWWRFAILLSAIALAAGYLHGR